ncbi:FIG00936276: hypothetical protein [hydrothermal vent metagenome]|uniref:Uncharacterized protein n=1 Tax=hydrothermal vent metagenome TaxID=652676 RepID=A0A1W1BEH5_9ZZZZ
MSDFKVTFTLKQHTPLIHFQASQKGATLRATELKPKFDRFLKEYAFNGSTPEEFLVDKTRDALDYKVKIIPSDTKVEKIEKINPKNKKTIPDPLYFGNMGDGAKKEFVTSTKILIEFKTFHSELLKTIQEHFESFLANTNFGTRQSKGYGSFYIAEAKFNTDLVKAKKVYRFHSKNWKNDIKLFYQFLRQGINLPNREGTRFYAKPAIFSYGKSKGWTWEKRIIKQHYFKEELKQQRGEAIEYISDKHHILRDLFGLSSNERWLSYKANITKEHTTIKRFKSPITFKVVDQTVYFWANNTIEKIINQEFKILCNQKGSLKLKTPKEFVFDDFFEFVSNIEIKKHIEQRYHNQPEFQKLSSILNELKANQ